MVLSPIYRQYHTYIPSLTIPTCPVHLKLANESYQPQGIRVQLNLHLTMSAAASMMMGSMPAGMLLPGPGLRIRETN